MRDQKFDRQFVLRFACLCCFAVISSSCKHEHLTSTAQLKQVELPRVVAELRPDGSTTLKFADDEKKVEFTAGEITLCSLAVEWVGEPVGSFFASTFEVSKKNSAVFSLAMARSDPALKSGYSFTSGTPIRIPDSVGVFQGKLTFQGLDGRAELGGLTVVIAEPEK